jgi:hypothetical protein
MLSQMSIKDGRWSKPPPFDALRFGHYAVLTCASCPNQIWIEKLVQDHVPKPVQETFGAFDFRHSPGWNFTAKATLESWIYRQVEAGKYERARRRRGLCRRLEHLSGWCPTRGVSARAARAATGRDGPRRAATGRDGLPRASMHL